MSLHYCVYIFHKLLLTNTWWIYPISFRYTWKLDKLKFQKTNEVVFHTPSLFPLLLKCMSSYSDRISLQITKPCSFLQITFINKFSTRYLLVQWFVFTVFICYNNFHFFTSINKLINNLKISYYPQINLKVILFSLPVTLSSP